MKAESVTSEEPRDEIASVKVLNVCHAICESSRVHCHTLLYSLLSALNFGYRASKEILLPVGRLHSGIVNGFHLRYDLRDEAEV